MTILDLSCSRLIVFTIERQCAPKGQNQKQNGNNFAWMQVILPMSCLQLDGGIQEMINVGVYVEVSLFVAGARRDSGHTQE